MSRTINEKIIERLSENTHITLIDPDDTFGPDKLSYEQAIKEDGVHLTYDGVKVLVFNFIQLILKIQLKYYV